MALTIEDGTIVAGANSYVAVAEFNSFCDLRGIDYSSLSTAEIEVLIIKAMDYVEGQRHLFKGVKSNTTQPLQWPRSGVYVDNQLIESTSIPSELKYGVIQLAIESMTVDLKPNRLPSDKGAVVSERIEGVLDIVYSNNAATQAFTPVFEKANTLLAPLYKNNGLYSVRA